MMGLMPIEIYNKEFNKSLRGYNVDEVNEFLDLIIKEFDLLIKEKKQLAEKSDKLEERILHFSTIENTLNKSIVIAQEASDKVTLEAEKHAEQIVKDAELEANRVVNAAYDEKRKTQMEVDRLKNHAKVLRHRFKLLIGSQLTLLENDEWDHLQESLKGE